MQLLYIACAFGSLAVGALAATVGELLVERGLSKPDLLRVDPDTGITTTSKDGVETVADEALSAAIRQLGIDHPSPEKRAMMSPRSKMFPTLRGRTECVVYCTGETGVPKCGDAADCNCSCLSMCGPNVGCTPYCSPVSMPGC